MNKQEVIEKLKEYGAWCTECHDTNGEKDRYVKVAKVRELLEKLDEPQKVKVSEEFDEWYQQIEQRWSKNAKEFALWKICQFGFGNGFEDVNNDRTSSTLSDWVCWNKEVAINAVWNGYEVEEEPKWKIINDDKYCLTSIEAGYGNSLHWAFDSTNKRPILFDNEETAMYTAYITGGIVEKVEV